MYDYIVSFERNCHLQKEICKTRKPITNLTHDCFHWMKSWFIFQIPLFRRSPEKKSPPSPPPNSNITKKKSLSTNLGRCKGAFFSRHEDKVVISEALGGCFKHLSRWPALRGRIRHGWSKPTSAEPTARCEQSKVTQDFCVPWWEELQSPWQPVRVLLKFNKILFGMSFCRRSLSYIS